MVPYSQQSSAIIVFQPSYRQIVRRLAAFILLFASHAALPADIEYRILGVSEAQTANIRSHIEAFRLGKPKLGSDADNDELIEDAVRKTRQAMRPYGYYEPVIDARIIGAAGDEPVLEVRVQPGPPIVVADVALDVLGEGAGHRDISAWRNSWPLVRGQVLDQTVWEDAKQQALELAEQHGYLSAEYIEHSVEIDLEKRAANLRLVLDTGQRYVFGEVTFGEHVLRPGIVEYIPRFRKGDPYLRHLLDKFRADLWKTGYFNEVEVEERRNTDTSPPQVDLSVEVRTDRRNSYQGSLGYGTDSGVRLQLQGSRQPMSSRGDRIDLGIGWQEKNDELSLRSTYRIPRPMRARQFWTADLILKNENQDLVVRRGIDDQPTRVARGKVNEYHLRTGRLKIRNRKGGQQQAFETLFVQFLNGRRDLFPVETIPDMVALSTDPDRSRFLRGIDNTVSFGIDYDLVAVTDKAWKARGRRDRGWLFTSSKAFGSDTEFTQVYFSTRRSYLRGERWKVLLRAEAGYTDAAVDKFSVDIDNQPLDMSVTRLPNFYRFKAGGSSSVRGYGFETLSNNLIGSNHIFTASAEVEFKVLENWSGALFFDTGNAFNEWSEPELRKGVGVGVRWYSIAGPIRVDFAKALDLEGQPWRLHLTIGTPLL